MGRYYEEVLIGGLDHCYDLILAKGKVSVASGFVDVLLGVG